MAFIKQIITDRVVVGGQRYTMTTLGDGRVEIVPSPDSVTAAGTPIDKDLLQRYEDFLEEVQIHLNNTANPHSVTKAQVKLSNVPNVDATNATNITSGTLNKDRLPTDIPQAKVAGLSQSFLDINNSLQTMGEALRDHEDNTSNPHGVTKAQVKLGNVTNDAQLKVSDKVTSIGASPTNNQIPSASAVKTYADTKLSNGTLIGTYTNGQQILYSSLDGYKYLLFALTKYSFTGASTTYFYGDSKIVTPDMFAQYIDGSNVYRTGIRLEQFDGSNLSYATVAVMSSTHVRLSCDTTYNLMVWGFN